MKSAIRRYTWGTALLLVAVGVALACGFDFPQMLLNQRQSTLLGLQPADWLTTQIEDLVPKPADKLQAIERADVTAALIEQRDVPAARIPQLNAMRAMRDGDSAYTAGEGLPEGMRLYVAGAIEFKAAHAPAALAFFKKVLQLPADERAARATWASYMAGRAQNLIADPDAPGLASHYFQQTRDLARGGSPDPLGLAVASYGEEGRIAFSQGNMQRAMELYLEQAARGSSTARESLRYVASRLAADSDLAARYIQDPGIQKLWFAQVAATGFDTSYMSRTSTGAEPTGWAARVIKVTAAIDRTKTTQLDGLAAIAYATGRFDLAASLATDVSTPLASLVRAKLALRAGDRKTAAQEYATAIGGRSDAGASGAAGLSDQGWSRLLAENGVLAMSRGDYADALQNLLEAGSEHWLDAAYVAERVLSLDELTEFAARRARTHTASDGSSPGDEHWNDYMGTPANPDKALRLLLARRQMRERRFDAAIGNFRDNDFAVDKAHPSVATLAAEYACAIHASQKSWTRISRAEAAFEAARLAKQFGMELMGYELAPDFSAFGGMMTFDRGIETDDYYSPNETVRLAANVPPSERFHYRTVAFDLANRAADDLPPRSQAFAAVLCANLRWAQAGNSVNHARDLYRRYVRDAAYVPWSTRFGERCEEPDFKRAHTFVRQARIHAARVALRPWKIPLELLAVAVIAGCAALAWRWRRRTRQ